MIPMRMKNTSGAILLAMLLTGISASAAAAEIASFSQTAFDQLKAEGKPVVVDIHATWCPVCKQQSKIIKSLSADPKFQDLTILKVDFDDQKAAVRQFSVSSQSTLIAFNKGEEVARTIGDTRLEGIEALLAKAVK